MHYQYLKQSDQEDNDQVLNVLVWVKESEVHWLLIKLQSEFNASLSML